MHGWRPVWIRMTEAVSIGVFAALVTGLARRIVDRVETWRDLSADAAAAVAGYVLADLASGFVHWFCDTFFEEDTPVLGPLLIHPFREHHRDPRAMTRHGFLELTGNSAMTLILPLGLAAWFRWDGWPAAALLAWCLAMFATNLFHCWAHLAEAPAWVLRLQRWGLILRPEWHARHHTGAGRSAYCVTNGWVNHMADRVGLFDSCERLFRAVGLPVAKVA